jgi:hypothetical protein
MNGTDLRTFFAGLLWYEGAAAQSAPKPPFDGVLEAVAEYVGRHHKPPPAVADVLKSVGPDAIRPSVRHVRRRVDPDVIRLSVAKCLADAKRQHPTFAETVVRIIREKKLLDTAVYKKACLDKRQFSKIRKGAVFPDQFPYTPIKRTAVAMALALELPLDETEGLLKTAGLAFSDAIKADVIMRWFFVTRRFDIAEVNAVLFANKCPLLGSVRR